MTAYRIFFFSPALVPTLAYMYGKKGTGITPNNSIEHESTTSTIKKKEEAKKWNAFIKSQEEWLPL